MEINQTLSNIQVDQSNMEVIGQGASLTGGQTYCLFIGATIVLVTIAICVTKIIQTFLLKTSCCCKLEKRIKQLEQRSHTSV